MLRYLFLLLILYWSCTSSRHNLPDAVVGEVGSNGMIVTANPVASEVGARILQQGGNAWDAAVAVQFALAVVYPVAGNIGGGGFAVYRSADGTSGSLDFREKASVHAGRDMYLDQDGNIIDRLSLEGHLAAGVPGVVDGMVRLHERFGSLPWEELLAPSVEIANSGYVLTEQDAHNYNRAQQLFKKFNSPDMLFIKEEGWEKGDTLFQPDLAATMSRIRDRGRAGFYDGETAEFIIDEMQRGNGMISQEDLDRYEAQWRDPVKGNYRGHGIISMPPPSSGGIALVQLLKSAEAFPIGKWGLNTVSTVHVLTEIEKRVYADRATFLGDPDHYDVPQEMLISDDYLAQRMADIDPKRTTPSQEIKEGKVDIIESVETTHFSVVDKDQNAVSITTTLNSYFGCKVIVSGAGFFLNNEMDDFSVKAGVPNQFGLLGSEANEIQPEKRMLSSMTPTIVEKDGELLMVVGSPGGSTIITSVFQTIMNVVDHDMGMQQAVNAKRIHHQWLPDRLIIEDQALSAKVLEELEHKGYEISSRGAIGRVDAVLVLPDGSLEGGADPRGDDRAIGF